MTNEDHTEHVSHTYDEETPVSVAIVQAISALENVDPMAVPTELGFTLYEHVDPSALETVVDGRTEAGTVVVTFEVNDYRIRVENTGRVYVDYSNVEFEAEEW